MVGPDATKRLVAEVYRARKFHPAWPPGVSLSLGDIGIQQERLFEREQNLSDLGVDLDRRSDPGGNWGHASEGTSAAEVGGDAGANALPVAAGGAEVQLSFSRKYAIFLRAEQVTIHSIDNLGEVKDKISALKAEGNWREEWSVVTQLISAERCLLLISGDSGATTDVRLSASGPLDPFELATGKARLSLGSHSGMLHNYEVETRSTPLLKLQRVKWGKLRPVGRRGRLRPPRDGADLGAGGDAEAEWEDVHPDSEE